jgi:type I restriction enzyme M protein
VDVHPDRIDNPTMGTIFEELIRKFNEALNENSGEQFTPCDVVHLMVDLMLAGDDARIHRKGVVCTVYDPCCRSGGMLMITKEYITVGLRKNGDLLRPAINADAEIHLFGREVNPETWAVSKSDLFMRDPTGCDADNIEYGSMLSHDEHAGRSFDYLSANPPYGKDWKRDEKAVREEHTSGAAGRFGPGLPRISDGQLLFLLHMLAHANKPTEGGSRIAIIMNGSPLFTGDAGSGESEIRRYVLEHYLLEALIALPEQKIAKEDEEDDVVVSHVFPTTHFGFCKITVERPLRLNFQASAERIALLEADKGFERLAVSKKKGAAGAKQRDEGRALQAAILSALRGMPDALVKDRDEFERMLDGAMKKSRVKLPAPARKAILSALSERDDTATICRDKKGNAEPDSEQRDTESVPLPPGEGPVDEAGVPASVRALLRARGQAARR